MMQYKHAFWNSTIMQFPQKTMCFMFFSVKRYFSITASIMRARIRPTFVIVGEVNIYKNTAFIATTIAVAIRRRKETPTVGASFNVAGHIFTSLKMILFSYITSIWTMQPERMRVR